MAPVCALWIPVFFSKSVHLVMFHLTFLYTIWLIKFLIMSICWAIETDLTGGCMYVYDFLKSLYNVCMYVLGIYFLVAVELFPHFLKWWFLAKHFGFFWWLFTFRFQICGPDYARFKNKHIVEQCPTENVSEFCNSSFLVRNKNKWILTVLYL